MAIHTQLPIYKVAYNLADLAVDLIKNMPAVLDMATNRDYFNCIAAHQRYEIGVSESRRISRQQCGFFHVRQHGKSYGRAVQGQRKLRRFLDPVLQLCTVPPSLIGVGDSGKHKPPSRSRAMSYNKLSTEERLLTKARWEGDCLIWFGDKDPCGYGRIRHGGMKGYPAHRLMYELRHGPIPDGLEVRHKCDNPSCINIEHLEPGTHKENMGDMFERGRANRAKGETHGRAKLTQTQVDEIRRRYIPGKYGHGSSVLAREFGVNQSTILAIVQNRHWKPVA
jgi:hypothetical protein